MRNSENVKKIALTADSVRVAAPVLFYMHIFILLHDIHALCLLL